MKIPSALTCALVAGCLAFGTCFGLSACGGGPASSSPSSSSGESAGYKLVAPGKITIGSDLDFPPMEYLDGNTPAGFGIAMIEEVCSRIGLEANVLPPQNFDTLVTQVAGGSTMDVAVSSMTITDEREQQVDFSTPYFDSNLAVVTLSNSPTKARGDLETKQIGVQSGSSGEAWVKENLKKATVKPFNGPSDALAALRSGDIAAVVYDLPVAQNHISGEYKDCKILEEIPTGEQYGIAINKDNPALTQAINKALEEMSSDGTMDKLKKQWIGKANSK